jgi:hypothetical protein
MRQQALYLIHTGAQKMMHELTNGIRVLVPNRSVVIGKPRTKTFQLPDQKPTPTLPS